MQSQDLRFERNQENKKMISDYNRNLIRQYVTKSKITFLFIITIWLVFLIQCIMSWLQHDSYSGLKIINVDVLDTLGGNLPDKVRNGEVYRIFTATLLHAGILHILMNSLSLLGFCAQVQAAFTTKLYFLVYIVGGIQGNMLFDFYHIMREDISPIAIGASTSICAIIGLFVANVIILHKKGENIERAKQIVISILISLVIISLLPGVDLLGHMGSLVSGLFLGLMLIPGEDKELSTVKKVGVIAFISYTCVLLTIFF